MNQSASHVLHHLVSDKNAAAWSHRDSHGLQNIDAAVIFPVVTVHTFQPHPSNHKSDHVQNIADQVDVGGLDGILLGDFVHVHDEHQSANSFFGYARDTMYNWSEFPVVRMF